MKIAEDSIGFGIYVRAHGAAEAVLVEPGAFAAASRAEDGAATRWNYSGCATCPALSRVELTRREADGVTQWDLAVISQGDACVERVQFPRVVVEEVAAHDELLMPSGYGDRIVDPVKAIHLFGRRRRRPPPLGLTFVDNTDDEIIYNYPALAGMQYMVLHNPGRTIYVAARATGPDSVAFRARAAGGRKVVLSVEHYPEQTGGRWEAPPAEVAVFGGGWRAAADRYRACMARLWTPPRLPAWIARGDFHGWVQTPLHLEGEAPRCRFRDIPDRMRAALAHGHDVLHLYGWMDHGHDTLYPDYNPNPALGDGAELRKALAQVRAMGGRPILYTNGKLIDVASEFHRRHGCACCARNANGEPFRENYGTSAEFHIACPGSSLWREHFVGVVRRLVGEYGAQGLQIDQVASTWLQPCWRKDHEHARSHDNALEGMERLLREVRDAGRACDPDFFVWAEGCHDRLGQCFDIHQGSYGEGPTTAFSVTVGQTFPEQFRYTWPRAVVVGGAGDVTGLCRTFAQGKPFDCSGDAFADPAFATLHAALLGLRKARPEYFARGVYRHDEGMRVLAPVLATSLQGARGRLVCLRVPGARPEQEFRTVLECAFSYGDVKALHPETCHLAAGARTDVMFTGPLAVVEFLEASLSST